MEERLTPSSDEDPQLEVLGEYQQSTTETLCDDNGRDMVVEIGNYPVVGSYSADRKQIHGGGIIFRSADRETGENQTLVQFHSRQELRDFAKSGKLTLDESIDRALFQEPSRKQEVPTEKPRLGLRR